MFMSKPDVDFGRAVESIMKCEEFKSNFARKLSNRFGSKVPLALRKEPSLQARPHGRQKEEPENAPERVELSPQLSPESNKVQTDAAVKPTVKLVTKNTDIRTTEEYAINMEVETLRWQLAQTESNRQMHIALLKQIVSFLNRVKEHIAYQKTDSEEKEPLYPRVLPRSFNSSDLPRSRSVLHVSRNNDCSLNPNRKMSTRKISKSISNVNGFKDRHGSWSQSKLSLSTETETAQKLTEEISRLVILASTVLSTKLPDLACCCSDSNTDLNKLALKDDKESKSGSNSTASLNFIEEDPTNAFILNEDTCNGITNKFIEVKDRSVDNFVVSPSPFTCGLENEFSDVKIGEKTSEVITITNSSSAKTKISVNKRTDFITANFLEDESGFSSMSSFQEIGIPIISIIPPSPCKEVGFLEEFPHLLEDPGKWAADTLQLDSKAMKVFWV